MSDNILPFTPTVKVNELQLTVVIYDIIYMRFVCQVIRAEIHSHNS
jgi:hypothetical protein